MRKLCGVCVLGVSLVLAAWAPASEPTGGPTTGWRGDGTGKYPAADPPTQWQRVSPLMKGLRYSANEPKEGEAGRPMPDGVVREWLVLGPVPFPKENKIDKETLPGEAGLAPADAQKTEHGTWKKVTLDSAYLDFATLFGKPAEAVAFVCTRIYSETGGAFRLNFTSTGGARIFLNGKAGPAYNGRIKVDLAKGWNRLLLRVAPGATGENITWYAVPVFHAFTPATYEESGIAWHTVLPGIWGAFYGGGQGVSAPIIVGDRLYMTSEPFDLLCLNKADGKLLWIRRASYFEAATDDEKKKPEYKDAEALATKLDAANAAIVAGPATGKLYDEKTNLERDLQKAMKAVDPEKYAFGTVPDIGYSGFTPTSDGQHLYTWSSSGAVACYDMDGKLQWTRIARLPDVEHGLSSSPLLVGGKVVIFNRDLVAFDAKTGAPAWTTPIVAHEGVNPGQPHGTHVAVTVGGVPLIAVANGCFFRASDGKKLYGPKEGGMQSVPSPVVEGDAVYQMTSGRDLCVFGLPREVAEPLPLQLRRIPVDISAFPKHYLPWHLSSPIIHEGLAYVVNNSAVFSVVDVAEGKVLYQKLLDLDVFQAVNEGAARGIGASLTLAGKYLYIQGNSGTTLVLAPGRTYKQIAKNKIENVVMVGHWAERQERFMANPVADGKLLFLRGEGGLWAVGAK